MAKIDLTNGAAAATPSLGKVSVYSKVDKNLYLKDDAGLETLLSNTDTGITALTGDVTASGSGSVVATIANSAVTNAKVATGIDAAKLADGTVSNAELQYINSLTSNAQTQISAKVTANTAITGATKTKITYDAKGLVTSGTDAAVADITGLSAALTAKVPYTGASGHVNLGAYGIDSAYSYITTDSNNHLFLNTTLGGSNIYVDSSTTDLWFTSSSGLGSFGFGGTRIVLGQYGEVYFNANGGLDIQNYGSSFFYGDGYTASITCGYNNSWVYFGYDGQLDLSNSLGSSYITFSGVKFADYNFIYDWTSGVPIIDRAYRQLVRSTYAIAIDFENCFLQSYTSGQKTLDFNIGECYDSSGTTVTMNYMSSLLKAGGNTVVHWGAQTLSNSSGTLKMTWSTSKLETLWTMKLGSSSTYAGLGGTLNTNITAVGNVGTGEDNLQTYTLPANVLVNNGDKIVVDASGTCAANANNKTLKLKFGGTQIFTTGVLAFNSVSWQLVATIIRTGAATQDVTVKFFSNSALLPVTVAFTTTAITLSSTAAILLTGEATANNDIVSESLITRFEPNAT
jgi:hypothetical protein